MAISLTLNRFRLLECIPGIYICPEYEIFTAAPKLASQKLGQQGIHAPMDLIKAATGCWICRQASLMRKICQAVWLAYGNKALAGKLHHFMARLLSSYAAVNLATSRASASIERSWSLAVKFMTGPASPSGCHALSLWHTTTLLALLSSAHLFLYCS